MLCAVPVIDASDIAAAKAIWQDASFSSHGLWGDPPAFGIVQRGDATLGLSFCDWFGSVPLNHGWAACICADDPEDLHAEFTEAGPLPTEIRRPDHFGCDDFDVADSGGNRLAFGQVSDPVPGPGLSDSAARG